MSDIEAFETLKDLVAAGREREGRVLDIEGRPAPYTYQDLSTNVWKAGNLFTHYGVHVEGDLAVAVGPKSASGGRDETGYIDASEPLLAVLGGALVGGVVEMAPTAPVETPVLVAPAHWDIESAPACTRLAYGGPPTDPDVSHFERNVWSENPIEPPETVRPGQAALQAGDRKQWTHEDALAVARRAVTDGDIGPQSRVRLVGPLDGPGAFVAGIVAPMAVGATIVVPDRALSDDESGYAEDPDGTIAVVTDEGADREIDRESVMGWLHEIRRV